MNKREKIQRWVAQGVIALYGFACLYLFYRQSIADLTVPGEIPYQSDLPLHISMIVEDGWYYSFTAYVYKALHVLCGGSTIGIAVFLGLMAWGTVLLMEEFLCFLSGWKKSAYTAILALSLNLVMPIFIPKVGEFRYISYQAGNIWHNSTYICMRLAALAELFLYFKLEKKYREGLSGKEWGAFALVNVICTGIKPSFLVAFSPIVGLFLLADLIRKVPLKRILLFGSALLPSALVLLWQNAVLFGEDTGNGIAWKPWYSFSLHTNIPKLAVVCSVLFCGLVILLTCKELCRDRIYLFTVLMSILGFLEAWGLVEQGHRASDGNFLWGYSFCLFVLFAVCAVKWLKMARQGLSAVIFGVLAVVYSAHLYCGLYFFLRLVGGAGYWMT